MPTVYLSLGSNLGDRERNLREALKRLDTPQVRVTGVSRIYETVPVGDTEEPVPNYLNCAARAVTSLPPEALLNYTQGVERDGDRVPTFRWGPRTIDIDILLYDNAAFQTDALTVPHPRLFERAFALRPLTELDSELVFPDGSTLRDRLADASIQPQVLKPWHE